MRTIPTVTGFVTEFVGRHQENGEEMTDRKILLCEVRDGRIAELTVYCSGDWDAELRARHAAETQRSAPMSGGERLAQQPGIDGATVPFAGVTGRLAMAGDRFTLDGFSGALLHPEDRGLRRGPGRLQRDDRPPAGA